MRRLLVALLLWVPCALFAQTAARWTKILPSATVQLRDPRCVSVSPEGLIYIADTGHHRVVAVDTTGRLVAETGGLGNAHGQFRWARAIIADRGNAVWVLDYGNRRIERFTRSLEYQGTFTITLPNDDTPHQPEAMAMSPQSDLYIYDRDAGRLVRYDPLFSAQAEIGSGGGSQFVTNVASIACVSAHGLFWWERGSNEIRHADGLLNPAAPLRLGAAPEDLRLAPADSCLLYATPAGIFRQCLQAAPSDTLFSLAELSAAGVTHIAGLAMVPDHVLYVLDGGTAAVYRVNLLRE
ncbi:MAG TPA: NHL repeat-containing protein [bacterium]|jgi:hypothetical protein